MKPRMHPCTLPCIPDTRSRNGWMRCNACGGPAMKSVRGSLWAFPANVPRHWRTISYWRGNFTWTCAGPGRSSLRPIRLWATNRRDRLSWLCGSWPYCASLCRGPISPQQRLWRRLIPFQGNGRACSPAAMCSCPVSRRRPTGKTTVFMTTNIESVWMRPVRSAGRTHSLHREG